MKTIDPVIRLLAYMMIFFTVALFYAEHMFHGDGQVFQVISNILSGLVGALLMGIKRELGIPDVDPASSRTTTQTTTVKDIPKSEAPLA